MFQTIIFCRSVAYVVKTTYVATCLSSKSAGWPLHRRMYQRINRQDNGARIGEYRDKQTGGRSAGWRDMALFIGNGNAEQNKADSAYRNYLQAYLFAAPQTRRTRLRRNVWRGIHHTIACRGAIHLALSCNIRRTSAEKKKKARRNSALVSIAATPWQHPCAKWRQ